MLGRRVGELLDLFMSMLSAFCTRCWLYFVKMCVCLAIFDE